MHMPEGNIFVAKPESLAELLGGIHKHAIALPNFQRPWVWEPEMVRDLIISVAYRYPVGSLLTMAVSTKSFALRPFEGSGTTFKREPSLMILDGQQRLTSLYQALYRREGIHIKNRKYYFYLDTTVLMSNLGEGTGIINSYFDKALFYVMEDKKGKKVRYDRLNPLYEITTRDQELAVGALPLCSIFMTNSDLADWKKDYLVQQSQKDMDLYLTLDGKWDQRVKPWLDCIHNYPFPVIELRADVPLGAICHIFEKVNSTGVPLDVFDLCTAILWAQNFHLNEEWEKTRKNLEKILPMQPLSGTYFLQGIALLDSLQRKRMSSSERVAVTCRKENLMELSADTVKKWWSILIDGYKEAAKFMADNGILSQKILPYSTLIIPLSAMFADLKHHKGKIHVGAAWSKIEKWYWCSVFSQRYSSQVETVSAQDYEQVMAWVDGSEYPNAVRTFSFRADTLQEITSIRNAIYKGVLCLLARGGAKDFGGGGKLSSALFYDTRQDHHHIFPIDALKKLNIADPRSNTIINKTLISATVNRSIGGNLPSKYIQKWRDELGSTTFDEILLTHRIDANVLSKDSWEDFVTDRRERLRQAIEDVCGTNIQQFLISDKSDTQISDSDSDDSAAD